MSIAGFKLNKTFSQGIEGCLGAIGQLQFIEDITYMDPYSSFLDPKRSGNFLV
jgi:hypothetical protein